MWDPPWPGIQPVSPALAGGFLATGPPGSPHHWILKQPESRLSNCPLFTNKETETERSGDISGIPKASGNLQNLHSKASHEEEWIPRVSAVERRRTLGCCPDQGGCRPGSSGGTWGEQGGTAPSRPWTNPQGHAFGFCNLGLHSSSDSQLRGGGDGCGWGWRCGCGYWTWPEDKPSLLCIVPRLEDHVPEKAIKVLDSLASVPPNSGALRGACLGMGGTLRGLTGAIWRSKLGPGVAGARGQRQLGCRWRLLFFAEEPVGPSRAWAHCSTDRDFVLYLHPATIKDLNAVLFWYFTRPHPNFFFCTKSLNENHNVTKDI